MRIKPSPLKTAEFDAQCQCGHGHHSQAQGTGQLFEQRHLPTKRGKQKTEQPHPCQRRQEGQQKGNDQIEFGVKPVRVDRVSDGKFHGAG